MAKRRAGSDLNRDNWERDDEPEEEVTGVGFQRASEEVLAGRKIKVARRRGSDAPTTGGSDKPSIFKNFAGFGSMASGGNSAPKFDFGAKKQEEPNAEMKKLFEASSFKPGTSSATPSFPSFSFTSTSNKENSKPLESNTEPVNGSADSSKKPSGYETDKQAFYEKLKALNEGVLQWIQKHVAENSLINLSPVFDDYKKHFEALEKQFRPKFSKSSGSSAIAEDTSSYKNFSFAPSKSTNSASPKTESTATPPESSKSKSLFSFGASDSKASESVCSPKDKEVSKPTFSFSSSTSVVSTSTSSTSELKSKDSAPTFSFGASANGNKPNESSASGGFSFGAKESSGFSFGGSGGLTFGAKEGSAFSGFGSKPTMTFAPAPSVAAEPKGDEDEAETPPKPEVLEVKEENSFYEKKCKLFYKKDGNFVDKGVGTLYLKTVPDTKKTQLIMRAATSLGNVLLNIVLNSSLPTQRMGKNNVLVVCVPNPPLDAKDASDKPVTMLIRVKTPEDADELYKKINESKGE
ncbi:Ran binding domain [Trinorchestia longiramus]|nr:Ran binding domain [Trinorchestia longiramus]